MQLSHAGACRLPQVPWLLRDLALDDVNAVERLHALDWARIRACALTLSSFYRRQRRIERGTGESVSETPSERLTMTRKHRTRPLCFSTSTAPRHSLLWNAGRHRETLIVIESLLERTPIFDKSPGMLVSPLDFSLMSAIYLSLKSCSSLAGLNRVKSWLN